MSFSTCSQDASIFVSSSKHMQFDTYDTDLPKENSLMSSTTVLSILTANMCACALDDATDQLQILGSGLFPAKNIQIEGIKERANKCCIEDPVFDPHSGDTFEEDFNKKKVMKIYYDSSKIAELLTQIKNELRYNRNYSTLTNYMELIVNAEKEDKQLFADEIENMALMDTLKQTLYNEQKNSKKEIQEMNEKIAILKDEREDVVFENLIRKRYIKTWEKARMSKNEYTYMLLEKKLENTTNEYKNKIEKEDRVNAEIKYFFEENHKDMLDAIDYWSTRYDQDTEARRFNTQILKEKRIKLRDKYVALKEIYDLHDKQINDYLELKEKKRIEAEILAFTISKAIKLQAWWRGIMVRRKLGKFDPDYMEKQIARNAASKGKKILDKKGKKK